MDWDDFFQTLRQRPVRSSRGFRGSVWDSFEKKRTNKTHKSFNCKSCLLVWRRFKITFPENPSRAVCYVPDKWPPFFMAAVPGSASLWLNNIYLTLTAENLNYFGCKSSDSAHQASHSLTCRFPSEPRKPNVGSHGLNTAIIASWLAAKFAPPHTHPHSNVLLIL